MSGRSNRLLFPKRTIVARIRAHGLSVSRRGMSPDSHLWDGASFAGGRGIWGEALLHEFGHWAMADAWHRALPEFGLGHPSFATKLALRTVSREESDDEEERASLMGCACAAKWLGPDATLANLIDHNWDSFIFEDVLPRLDEVRERCPLKGFARAFRAVEKTLRDACFVHRRVW